MMDPMTLWKWTGRLTTCCIMLQANRNLTTQSSPRSLPLNFMGMWTTHGDFLQGDRQPILACLKEFSFWNFGSRPLPISTGPQSRFLVLQLLQASFFRPWTQSWSNQTSMTMRRSKPYPNGSRWLFWTCFGITFYDGMMLSIPLNAVCTMIIHRFH